MSNAYHVSHVSERREPDFVEARGASPATRMCLLTVTPGAPEGGEAGVSPYLSISTSDGERRFVAVEVDRETDELHFLGPSTVPESADLFLIVAGVRLHVRLSPQKVTAGSVRRSSSKR